MADAPHSEPARLTPEELDDLSDRIISDEVYIANDAKGIEDSFMLVLSAANLEESYIDNIGALYEELSKAGPRGVNGRPFFTSARFLHKKDLGPLIDKIEEKGVMVS